MSPVLVGQIVLGVYAVLLAVGGVIGYTSAGSRPSLIAGIASAVIAALCLVLSATSSARAGLLGGAILAGLLLVFFGSRFARGRKFMPGGLMTLVSLAVVVVLLERALRGRRRFSQTQGRPAAGAWPPMRVAGRLLACAFCSAILLMAFAIPVAVLVGWSLGPSLTRVRPLWQPAISSLVLSAGAAMAACAVALMLAYARRLIAARPLRLAVDASALGYAMPGSVVAVGVLVVASALDGRLEWAAARLGVTPPDLIAPPEVRYPPMARKLGREAVVEVRVLVDETGKVARAETVGTPLGYGFEDAAIEAARRARYRPATKDGVRVKMWTSVKLRFENP